MEINRLSLEHIMQTGGEGAMSLFTGNYKWLVPTRWKFVVPVDKYNISSDILHKHLLNATKTAVENTAGLDVAVLLSGGVDSVTLLRYITKFYPDSSITAYHTDWNYAPRSEVKHARRAADFCNIGLKVIDVSPEAQIPFIDEALTKTKTVDYSIIAAYMGFKQMKADGIDVAFNALGLDEYLAGYPIHRRLYDRMSSNLPKFVPPINSSSRYIRWAMRKFGNNKSFFYFNTMINPHIRFGLSPRRNVKSLIKQSYSGVQSTSIWDTIQKHLANQMFYNYGTNIRRAATAAGIEVEFPWMHYKLANYCFGVRPQEKYNKEPLRKLMVDTLLLPPDLANRGRNWHDGVDWDKFAWGGTIEPYTNSPEFMKSIRPDRFDVTQWFNRKTINQFWSNGFKKPSRVYIQMLIFLKLLALIK